MHFLNPFFPIAKVETYKYCKYYSIVILKNSS